jgi:glutathione S-transferase
MTRPWIVWTSELSPFGLKLLLMAHADGLPLRVLPAEGGIVENFRVGRRRDLLRQGRLALTWPEMTTEDEFPEVPYLFGPDGENLYDSTAIAVWLDRRSGDSRWVPEDPGTAFVARLIDDYADEFGLYMVHHNRWKVSARDNDAGRRLAREFSHMFGPAAAALGWFFPRRQVRRLPYLFSVAPQGYAVEGLSSALVPPSRPGFAPTHDLLEQAFARLLDILEALLAERPFLLGQRLTLADAAVYGQLAMNLSDPGACRWIREAAPRTHAWLEGLDRRDPSMLAARGTVAVDAALAPLLTEIGRVHVPLMEANHEAWRRERAAGGRVFNEKAFDRGEALYDGELDGRPFRSVAKSFQARVWIDCCRRWQALDPATRTDLATLLPAPTVAALARLRS